MELHDISIKFFAKTELSLDASIPVFHQWIREKSVDGLLLDVADYKHVHHGPGVMLIGHECDYSLDLAKGKPGLMYRHKRDLSGDLASRVKLLLGRAAKACRLLEDAGIGSFDSSTAEIAVYDRLQAPNTPETFGTLKPQLQAALQPLLGEVTLTAANSDPRSLFAVHLDVKEARPLSDLT